VFLLVMPPIRGHVCISGLGPLEARVVRTRAYAHMHTRLISAHLISARFSATCVCCEPAGFGVCAYTRCLTRAGGSASDGSPPRLLRRARLSFRFSLPYSHLISSPLLSIPRPHSLSLSVKRTILTTISSSAPSSRLRTRAQDRGPTSSGSAYSASASSASPDPPSPAALPDTASEVPSSPMPEHEIQGVEDQTQYEWEQEQEGPPLLTCTFCPRELIRRVVRVVGTEVRCFVVFGFLFGLCAFRGVLGGH
jgi:hypothetical protein